jgi:hypothetical protein
VAFRRRCERPKRRWTAEPLSRMVREAKAPGEPSREGGRQDGMAEPTVCRWRRQEGGRVSAAAVWRRQRERAHAWLKPWVAALELESMQERLAKQRSSMSAGPKGKP